MTDKAKALVERLRREIVFRDHGDGRKTMMRLNSDGDEAADRIEALETQLECANEALRERLDICETQAREIERLREALQKIGSERSVTYHPDAQVMADGWREHCRDMRSIARAALAGDSHDQ